MSEELGLETLGNHGLKTRATVIPCIDVMGGKVVQLVNGEKKALELESADEAVEMFKGFPLLHIIDLDAALGRGNNRELVRNLLGKVNARVGGGVRTVEDAATLIKLGVAQVIVGTSAYATDGINADFLRSLVDQVGRDQIVVAMDVKGGQVAIKGWQDTLDLTPGDVLAALEPYCSGILCTYVDREGMLEGTNLPFFLDLRSRTNLDLIAAGGITTLDEVRSLVGANIQVALGMAIYTGRINLSELAAISGSN